MPTKRTWGDVREERERDLFVGQDAELEVFERNLGTPDDHEYLLFNVHGQAGMGKTWLLR